MRKSHIGPGIRATFSQIQRLAMGLTMDPERVVRDNVLYHGLKWDILLPSWPLAMNYRVSNCGHETELRSHRFASDSAVSESLEAE